MNRPRTVFAPARPRAGFTLLELMVSIALVLILILGINQVFKIASDTVNAGQALSRADRDHRGIQGVLGPDFQNAVVTGAPCFIIRSEFQAAFRNQADKLGDKDGKELTVDLDGDGSETGPAEAISPAAVNARNHRIDELMFFASYMYHRQTASGDRLSASGSANEAFLWYGHLQLANNQLPTPSYYGPGEGGGGRTLTGRQENGVAAAPAGAKNDNNLYASQWALGRMPILLAGENPDPTTSFIFRAPGPGLAPLAEKSNIQDPRGGAGKLIQWSTCDVAATSIAGYRDILLDRNNWGSGDQWWETIIKDRFNANAIPSRPLTADKVSRAAPIFVQGCTQFIVEYAGDFVAQNNDPSPSNADYGKVTGHVFGAAGAGDGVTDYIVAPGTAGGRVRRTRWYGMPRNVDTADDKPGAPMILSGGNDANKLIDVVPVRDVVRTFDPSYNTGGPLAFEPDIDRSLPTKANYAAPGGIPATPTGRYVAAWGPSALTRGSLVRPTMIRITAVVDDPSGRMGEGQTYEYVFDLP